MSDDDVLRESTERVGTILGGKYHIDGVLGLGGMAVVYAATHRNRKRFAIKVLHSELSARRDIRARFLREGYVANSVNHPGVVAVLDDDVDADGSAFLVMELLDGATVEDLRSRLGGRFPVREALAVAQQLLDVLAVAHDCAVIHRDIKPANLFVSEAGHVKVLDFGIARLRDVAAGVQSTRAGAIVGTPSFMAPEQALAQGDEIDPRTDIWAAGACLFTMLSGQFVHEGDNARQLMIRAATVPARSLAAVAPETPSAVVDLVAKALEFEKSARWESASAMREAVARIRHDLFGAFSHDHLKACLERAPCKFESAQTEVPHGEALAVPAIKGGVQSPPPAGTTPESPFARLRDAESEVATTTSKPVSDRTTERKPRRRQTAIVAAVAVVAGLGAGSLVIKSVRPSSQDREMSAASTRQPPFAESAAPAAPPVPAPSANEISPAARPADAPPALGGPRPSAAPAVASPPRTIVPTASSAATRASTRGAVLAPSTAKADSPPSAPSTDALPRDPLHIELQ
jgi:serine/threonine protein kinase